MIKASWPYKGLIENVYAPGLFAGKIDAKNILFSSVARKSFLSAYKHIPPIDAETEKIFIEYVEEVMPEVTDVELKKQMAKVAYTIGTIL